MEHTWKVHNLTWKYSWRNLLPVHTFNDDITSNDNEGGQWYAHLGPLLTAFRASCVSDPDIWKTHPLATYRTLGHECFIASEFMGRFDNLDKELFALFTKLIRKILIHTNNAGKVNQFNMAVDLIRRGCLTCHTYTIYIWVLANFCMLNAKSLRN